MTSSVPGERRWASARRGAMTVLGKVPKPINLPSQRLENHGMDPSVEIVPKGTLSWGSRSSSASNAWGTSSLSPNTDGGTTSPSYLSGHLSSGSRPSTAGSDKSHEPTASAWGPNSRPSSASGLLTSNQTSLASLRPRSAEPRPGSSQLSRFAEHSEHPVAWSAPGTAEKLGMPSKNDGFSLTSGDFPTLGSEKDNSGKNADSQDRSSCSRPGSSSGGGVAKEMTGTSVVGNVSVNANVKSGAGNSWKREDPPYNEDGARPGMEKWQGNPQPYPNASVPPQHYDAWHGVPPQHPQGGVWFRGPPGAPPFGAQVPPGGFPMEPFPYFPPQIPAAALANPQPGPPIGGGPRGHHHPKNGEIYRPHMPESYIRPGMPIRPGFYPGPVAFEGYYGPPMGYCNSNERDAPFAGMPGGPSVYNRYPGQAPEAGNSHSRHSGYGPTNQTMIPEKVESGHPHDTRGPYKVLLKQHDGWDRRNEEQRGEGAVTSNASCHETENQPRESLVENDWRSDRRKEGERARRNQGPASQNPDQGSVAVNHQTPEILGNRKVADTILVKKLETETLGTQDIEQPLSAKNSSLIQEIEDLNAKARVSDGRSDTASAFCREDQRNKFQVNYKSTSSVNESGSGMVNPETSHATDFVNYSHEASSRISNPRRSTPAVHSRSDHRGRGKLNNQEGDGWGKKSFVSESTAVVSTANSKIHSPSHDHMHDSVEGTEKSGSYPQGRCEEDSRTSMYDPNDPEAQRAKRELAKQRAKQLKEEEEERTRRQMAKARAKLEELNRRTQVEGANQKLESASSGAVQIKQEESQTSGEPLVAGRKFEPQISAWGSNLNTIAQNNETSSSKVEKSTVPSSELSLGTQKSAYKEVVHDESVPLQQEVIIANASHQNNAPRAHDNISRQTKQKHNNQLEKKSVGKLTSLTEAPKCQTDAVVNVSASVAVVANSTASSSDSSLTGNPSAILESSSHPRKKNNRSGKNKHRADNTSLVAALPSSISNDKNLSNATLDSGKSNASKIELDSSSVQLQTIPTDAYQSSEQHLSLPNEDSQGRVSTQWKSQHPRRMPRNSQAVRHSEKLQSSDAVFWAPVRSQNKTDGADEVIPKNEAGAVSAVKSDQVQNNSRNKRAEMERYVPKPVAKEMAYQGSTQQGMVSVAHQTAVNEDIGGSDSVSQGAETSQPASVAGGKVSSAVESRNGNVKQNKPGKAHGSWRQRGSTESTTMQGFEDRPSYTSNVGQIDPGAVIEQPKSSDDWNDGWNMPDEPKMTVPVSAPIGKDQGIPGRRKQHPFKGHRTMGNNHDLDQQKSYRGDADRIYTKSSSSEMGQTDLPSASKENQAVGERPTSHWQPKSQAFAANSHRGNRVNGGENNGMEVGWTNKKEAIPQDANPLRPTPDKETNEHVPPHRRDHFKSERNSAGEGQNRRERKTGSHRVRPISPNDGPVSPVELAPNMDARQEQRSSTGFRRNGNQNNRFSRGQESRGDWNYSGHDVRQQNPPANRDRQRHSSHFEYQPVGLYNSSENFNQSEGSREGFQNTGGGKVKERGQVHSRRGGNFHGRQSGSGRVVQDME